MGSREGNRPEAAKTRRAIVDLLKDNGTMEVKELAQRLELTQMAIRLQLYALRDEKLADCSEEHRPVGRPAQVWRLTAEANRLFHDGHANLAVSLIDTVRQTLDAEDFGKVLEAISHQRISRYKAGMPSKGSIRRRVECLASLRSEEGYMAETAPQDDGSVLMIQKHCPVCTAAGSCKELCSIEPGVFQEVLGPDVEIERLDHIQAGDHCCSYRISKSPALCR